MNHQPTKSAQPRATGVTSRRAFSLLEVLLALGIFLTAFVALSQLSSNGMNAAVEARLTTNAILRCESKLAELVAAVEPLEDVADQVLTFCRAESVTGQVLVIDGGIVFH